GAQEVGLGGAQDNAGREEHVPLDKLTLLAHAVPGGQDEARGHDDRGRGGHEQRQPLALGDADLHGLSSSWRGLSGLHADEPERFCTSRPRAQGAYPGRGSRPWGPSARPLPTPPTPWRAPAQGRRSAAIPSGPPRPWAWLHG